MEHQPSNVGPYEVLSSDIKYKNKWITVREDTVIRPGGSRGIFGIVEMLPGSSVLAIDERENVYLAREFKYGIARESLEVISGGLEPDESPLEAAKRELREELGLEADDWIDLDMVDPFTTVVRSPNYMFLTRGLKHGKARPDEGEELRLVNVPFDAVLQFVLTGKITQSASCVAVLRAARILGK